MHLTCTVQRRPSCGTRMQTFSFDIVRPSIYLVLTPAMMLISTDHDVVCRRRVMMIDTENNAFRSIVLPLSHESDILRCAVMAYAANDLRNRTYLPTVASYELSLLEHKQNVLSLLRLQHRQFDAHATTRNERDALLLTMFLLTYLDIADGTTWQWSTHLEGCTAVIHHFGVLHGTWAFSPEVLSLVYSCLNLVDVFFNATQPALVATHTPVLSAVVSGILPVELQAEDSMCINVYTGLSPELLDIIQTTSHLSRNRHRLPADAPLSETSTSAAKGLFRRLRNLKQHFPGRHDPGDYVLLTAEAYLQAAHIYLDHAVFGLPRHAVPIRNEYHPRLLSILELLHQMEGPDVGCMPYPLWPLFIAANFACEDERPRILDLFATLLCHRSRSNVPMVQTAVETIWKQQDLSHDSTSAVLGELAWRKALAILGWKLALV
jgi:hypothetical protein